MKGVGAPLPRGADALERAETRGALPLIFVGQPRTGPARESAGFGMRDSGDGRARVEVGGAVGSDGEPGAGAVPPPAERRRRALGLHEGEPGGVVHRRGGDLESAKGGADAEGGSLVVVGEAAAGACDAFAGGRGAPQRRRSAGRNGRATR